jgi:peptidoglycan/LPS O-acetylase OafA/YrhL
MYRAHRLNSWLDKMLRFFLGALIVLLPAFAHAKQTSDYVPPPYGVRLLQGGFGLLLLVLPIAVAVSIVARMAGPDWLPRMVKSVVVLLCVVLVGAMIAALDGLNDEGWNPAFFGSPFVAFSFPVGLYFAIPRSSERRQTALVLGVIVAALGTIVVAALGGEILHWLRGLGWPVMW